eukprot:389095-Amphidinium_carterae.1
MRGIHPTLWPLATLVPKEGAAKSNELTQHETLLSGNDRIDCKFSSARTPPDGWYRKTHRSVRLIIFAHGSGRA